MIGRYGSALSVSAFHAPLVDDLLTTLEGFEVQSSHIVERLCFIPLYSNV